MSILHAKLEQLLPAWRAEIQELLAQHKQLHLDTVTVAQVLGGMRGLRGVVCDTSSVDPQAGLFLRGIPVLDLVGKDSDDVFWLLLTGELPNAAERDWLRREHSARQSIPRYFQQILETLPPAMHPTLQYATLLMTLQRESHFAAAYGTMPKTELWRPALEDALNLRSWTSGLLAQIHIHWKRAHTSPGARYLWNEDAGDVERLPEAQEKTFHELVRLYQVVHSDHESGNASAFACAIVGSALADPYLALVTSLEALAGPLHGQAAQACLEFILDLKVRLGVDASDEQIAAACWQRLNSKQIIPGFGHAVLRGPDPRFLALQRFGEEHCADEPVFQFASKLYRVAPQVLHEHGAASSTHPNVDAIGGVLLHCCGQIPPEFFTIMFSHGQMHGLLAQYILARGLGMPIIHPRSVTLSRLRSLATAAA